MLSTHDYLAGGVIPYGLECEPAVLWHLPARTYLELKLPSHNKFGQLVVCGRYSAQGSEYAVIASGVELAYTFKAFTSFVPVADADALKMAPVGKKVHLYVQDPSMKNAMAPVPGFIVSQGTRRVRVQFSYKDGSPGERTVPVSQLVL